MGFLVEAKGGRGSIAEQEKTNGQFVVEIGQYRGSSERMTGYQKLQEAGLTTPHPIYVLTPTAFEEYQRRGLTEELQTAILKAFREIRQKNPVRGVFLGWRTVLPGGKLPPGPRTAGIYNKEEYLEAVKTSWQFAQEQGYDTIGAEITLVLHPFIDAAQPPMKESPFLQWPGGDVTPLPDGLIQIQATYGPDEAVQSCPADKWFVRLEGKGGEIRWEIVKKTATLIAREGKYQEILISQEDQRNPTLTLEQVEEVARASKRIPGHRLEFIFQPGGVVFRECIPFNATQEDFFFLRDGATQGVVVITSEADIQRIKPPVAIVYLPPELFRERLIPQISKILASSAKENDITLIVLSHGSIATQHMVTRFRDFRQSVLFVGDNNFEDGEMVWVFRGKEGSPQWKRMSPIPLEDTQRMREATPKARNLSYLFEKGLPVPKGFYLPEGLFRRQLVSLGLDQTVEEAGFLSGEALAKRCQEIQEAIGKSGLPEELETKIQENLALYPEGSFSVRSAEAHEDRIGGQRPALAGIFESFIGIKREEVPQKIRECWASAFSPDAIHYLNVAGIPPANIEMGVLIHETIEGRGGVMYTQTDVTISAGKSPERITSGTEENPHNIIVKREGEILREALHGERILSVEEIKKLANTGLKIEQIFGRGQDIEWVIEEGTGEIYVLQSRPA